jgi:cell filamentation protein
LLDDLEQFERLATAQRLREGLPSVPLTADGYCELHRHIFQDVYQWAGKFRTVDISKGGHLFCRPAFIAGQMDGRFKAIRQGLLQNLTEDELFARAADHLCELNAIHPFREGNGRTLRAFLEVAGRRAGHAIHVEHIEVAAGVAASRESFASGNSAGMRIVVGAIVGPMPDGAARRGRPRDR